MARSVAAIGILAVFIGVQPAGGRQTPGAFPRGEIVERVVVATDSIQSYALYLPSYYRPDKPWPVVFLMDPRGRALVPLTPLRAAAERLGYIVVSSYNTMSDGPLAPNERALEALLTDVPARFSIDMRRIYLMGFSGTARAAWGFGYRLKGHVAGIVGFGGGPPGEVPLDAIVLAEGTPFVFFGGSGTTDFNFLEMRDLDVTLDRLGVVHRLRFFDGSHSWPPAEVFTHALDWMEVQAVKAGLVSRGGGWVDTLFMRHLDEARAVEASGRLYEASMLYRAITDDFAELHDTAEVEKRATELEESRSVRRIAEALDRFASREIEYVDRFFTVVKRLRTQDKLPSPEEVRRQLRIDDIQRRAESAEDSIEVTANERLLEMAFVHLSFYEPRDYLDQGDFERALLVLHVAREIKPGHARVCYYLARTYAQLGDVGEALEAVECLVGAGAVNADGLLEDPYLEPLRNNANFRDLVERLRRRGRARQTPAKTAAGRGRTDSVTLPKRAGGELAVGPSLIAPKYGGALLAGVFRATRAPISTRSGNGRRRFGGS